MTSVTSSSGKDMHKGHVGRPSFIGTDRHIDCIGHASFSRTDEHTGHAYFNGTDRQFLVLCLSVRLKMMCFTEGGVAYMALYFSFIEGGVANVTSVPISSTE